MESSRKELSFLKQGRSLESGIHSVSEQDLRAVFYQWRYVARGTRNMEFLVFDGVKALDGGAGS